MLRWRTEILEFEREKVSSYRETIVLNCLAQRAQLCIDFFFFFYFAYRQSAFRLSFPVDESSTRVRNAFVPHATKSPQLSTAVFIYALVITREQWMRDFFWERPETCFREIEWMLFYDAPENSARRTQPLRLMSIHDPAYGFFFLSLSPPAKVLTLIFACVPFRALPFDEKNGFKRKRFYDHSKSHFADVYRTSVPWFFNGRGMEFYLCVKLNVRRSFVRVFLVSFMCPVYDLQVSQKVTKEVPFRDGIYYRANKRGLSVWIILCVKCC